MSGTLSEIDQEALKRISAALDVQIKYHEDAAKQTGKMRKEVEMFKKRGPRVAPEFRRGLLDESIGGAKRMKRMRERMDTEFKFKGRDEEINRYVEKCLPHSTFEEFLDHHGYKPDRENWATRPRTLLEAIAEFDVAYDYCDRKRVAVGRHDAHFLLDEEKAAQINRELSIQWQVYGFKDAYLEQIEWTVYLCVCYDKMHARDAFPKKFAERGYHENHFKDPGFTLALLDLMRTRATPSEENLKLAQYPGEYDWCYWEFNGSEVELASFSQDAMSSNWEWLCNMIQKEDDVYKMWLRTIAEESEDAWAEFAPEGTFYLPRIGVNDGDHPSVYVQMTLKRPMRK